ncbi:MULTISPECIES: hypothetical protein [unclassified Paenibacillus]|nr:MULTISPECIES: hypothetical protein [unclassified Paenibacillus]
MSEYAEPTAIRLRRTGKQVRETTATKRGNCHAVVARDAAGRYGRTHILP